MYCPMWVANNFSERLGHFSGGKMYVYLWLDICWVVENRPPLGCCLVRELMEKCDLGPLEFLRAQALGAAVAFLGKHKDKGYIK